MKYKFLAMLVLALTIFRLNSMERQFNIESSQLWQQLPEELKARVLSHAAWYSLPPELKLYTIYLRIERAKNVTEVISSLNAISRTNKELYNFAQVLIQDFTKKYIQQHPDLAYEEFFDAVQANRISVVRTFITAGINVNVKDERFGNTALIWAVQNNNKEIVQMLLDKGADVNVKNIYGYTALMEADREIVKMLTNYTTLIAVKRQHGLIVDIQNPKNNKERTEKRRKTEK